MPGATRVGDSETGPCNMGLPCCPHTRNGVNNEGSGDVIINGQKAHRLNDSGPCNCPHSGAFETTSGSSSVFINNKAATRIGDETTCKNCSEKGSHVGGSENVIIGG